LVYDAELTQSATDRGSRRISRDKGFCLSNRKKRRFFVNLSYEKKRVDGDPWGIGYRHDIPHVIRIYTYV
jgi:hypothetical protein